MTLRRIDGGGDPPLTELEAVLSADPTWPKTDAALANVLNLLFLVGVLLSPAVVWLTWRAVL